MSGEKSGRPTTIMVAAVLFGILGAYGALNALWLAINGFGRIPPIFVSLISLLAFSVSDLGSRVLANYLFLIAAFAMLVAYGLWRCKKWAGFLGAASAAVTAAVSNPILGLALIILIALGWKGLR